MTVDQSNARKQAGDSYREGFEAEFFGFDLFQCEESEWAFELFERKNPDWSPSDSPVEGHAVYLKLVSHEKPSEYQVYRASIQQVLKQQPPVPILILFEEKVRIGWISDSGKSADEWADRFRGGGQKLAQLANEAFIEVLQEASSDGEVSADGRELRKAMAEAIDKLHADDPKTVHFVFSGDLRAQLKTIDSAWQSPLPDRVPVVHYLGKTSLGPDAYWADGLPADMALVLDRDKCVAIFNGPRIGFVETQDIGSSGAVLGRLRVNPIVTDTRAVIAITDVSKTVELGGQRNATAASVRSNSTLSSEPFVALERINELEALPSDKFDVTRLIGFCEEINKCYANECYLAVAMLTRAIMDHVPPIFGQATFSQVASSHGGQSIKKSLQQLEKSLRPIADQYLHQQIRSRESTPAQTEVQPFIPNLSVLLDHVILKLK